MLGEKAMRGLADMVLAASTAPETEVLISHVDSALTRFANSTIHQNVAETNTLVRVRVAVEQRVGTASTNDLRPEALRALAGEALSTARFAPVNPDWPGLPAPQSIAPVDAWVEATAQYGPDERAAQVAVICHQARAAGAQAFGAFTIERSELAVANSHGVWAYQPGTRADLNTVIMAGDGSGYGSFASRDVSGLDVAAVAARAVEKALRSRNPRTIAPGEYAVILEPKAVADMLQTFAAHSFNAEVVQEGRSFMGLRAGQPVMDPRIFLWDDGHDPSGLPLAFDHEGVPRRRVDFVVGGVAQDVVYNSLTASKDGKTSTGHAVAGSSAPLPLHWFMAPGDATVEDMVATTERGVYVTRFWYTRVVHPMEVVVTGMTRDGTFWIEKGEIAYPIRNLRFTQSYLQALNAVDCIGRATSLEAGSFFGHGRVPALKLHSFSFTGSTSE